MRHWRGAAMIVMVVLSFNAALVRASCTDATRTANKQDTAWAYGAPQISFEWSYGSGGDGDHDAFDLSTENGLARESYAWVSYTTGSADPLDKTVSVRAHVTGVLVDFGQDGVQGTGDDVLYRIDQTSDYSECDYDLTAIAVTLDAVDDMDVIDPQQTVTCTVTPSIAAMTTAGIEDGIIYWDFSSEHDAAAYFDPSEGTDSESDLTARAGGMGSVEVWYCVGGAWACASQPVEITGVGIIGGGDDLDEVVGVVGKDVTWWVGANAEGTNYTWSVVTDDSDGGADGTFAHNGTTDPAVEFTGTAALTRTPRG